MEQRFSFGDLTYDGLYVGPYYPSGIDAFHQAYVSKSVPDSDYFLKAAFSVGDESEFKFVRKATWPYVKLSSGKHEQWEKMLHFVTPSGADIILLIPPMYGKPLRAEYYTAILTKGNVSDEELERFATEYSQRYVPPE